ncbi:MAG: hypothetical protein NXI32_05110 [bacterium]|nr:hypothetical protein [bacterium]
MTDAKQKEFVKRATNEAKMAWAEYIRKHGIEIKDFAKASQILTKEIQEAIWPAIEEAKEAQRLRMGEIAAATFTASMRVAGINAAKKCRGV